MTNLFSVLFLEQPRSPNAERQHNFLEMHNFQLLSEQCQRFWGSWTNQNYAMRGCWGWQGVGYKTVGQWSQDLGMPTCQWHMYWTRAQNSWLCCTYQMHISNAQGRSVDCILACLLDIFRTSLTTKTYNQFQKKTNSNLKNTQQRPIPNRVSPWLGQTPPSPLPLSTLSQSFTSFPSVSVPPLPPPVLPFLTQLFKLLRESKQRHRALKQTIGFFCGDTGLFCEDVGPFCREIWFFCGDSGLVCGDVGLLCGDAGLLCRDMEHFCGGVGLLCREIGFFCGVVWLFVQRDGALLRNVRLFQILSVVVLS